MKIILSFILAFAVGPILHAQSENAHKISQILDKAVENGVAVGISCGVLQLGKAPQYFSVGYSDAKENIPYDHQTINRIASISKTITAVTVLQLIENNHLSLDTRLADILPLFDTKYHLEDCHQASASTQFWDSTNNLSGLKT